MTKKLILAFLLLALAVASAKTYSVTLFGPAVVAGTELKAGEYKLTLSDGNKVVMTNGKASVESVVKVEESETKYSSTSIRVNNEGGKARVQQIRLGGTKLRLVFD